MPKDEMLALDDPVRSTRPVFSRGSCVALAVLLSACSAPGGHLQHSAPLSPENRASTAISLLNPGFELPGEYEHDLAKGWSCAQHAGADSFEFKRDSTIFRSGGFSLSMRRFGREPWGLCDQKVTLDASRPRRLEFGGYLRAEGVAPEAVELNLRFQRAGVLLKTARIRPDLSQPGEPWRAHSLSAEIPGGATHVVLGLELHGNGRVWLDDTWVQALP